MIWSAYGKVVGTKFLGEIEADTEEEAMKKANELDADVSLCWSCSGKVSDPQIDEIFVEEVS